MIFALYARSIADVTERLAAWMRSCCSTADHRKSVFQGLDGLASG